jgi:T5SS/PEP-CTERM-associated repeat protein/autotransporter-associated beta strand protein
MKPNCFNRHLRASLFANLVVAITPVGSIALAGDVFWDGSTDSDWNHSDNWNADRVPSKAFDFDNAIINTLTNFPVIFDSLSDTPADIKVGTGSGNTGRIDHNAGTAAAGNGNWTVIGEFGGNGTYNLADTNASGGSLTGFGLGSGSFSTQRLYVSRENNATGEMAVNTTGEVNVFNDMYVGQGGTGVLRWDAGILNRNGDGGWMVVGLGGSEGNGTFEISGGTINAANDTIVGLNTDSTGSINLAGGTYNAGGIWVGRDGGTGTWTVEGLDTELTSSGEVYIGGNAGSFGLMTINSGAVALNNWVNVGRDGGSGTLEMTGGSLTVERALRIGFGTGGIGTLTLSGGAQVTAATISEVVVIGGDKGTGEATVTGAGTLLKSTGEFYVGNDDDSIGELTVSGGVVESGSWLGIGRNGSTGTLTINGTGVVNQGVTDSGSRLELTNFDKATTATLNLDGGTLTTNGIVSGSNGTRQVFLNGGVLKPRIDNGSFLEGMSSVTIKAGGALIDTDSKNIAINQSMVGVSGDGGLNKSGGGSLLLNGNNTFNGTTTVTGGELGGSGSVSGPLLVQNGASVSPGSNIGVFGAGNTTISGNYRCEIDGNGNDRLNVTGSLNLSSTSDSIDFVESGEGATLPVYVIASYTTLSGTFNTVENLPSGYSLDYTYNGGTQIAITRPLTPYESWLETYFPGEGDPAIIGLEADPDGDNQANKLEFALGGNPDDAGDTARIHVLTEDGSDAGTAKELLLTIAVRDGLGVDPVFVPAAGGNPTATQDGVTYTIQGGADLDFTGTVSVVDPVTAGLDPAPAGYEYRTFSLDGSDGLGGKGFMRVAITP